MSTALSAATGGCSDTALTSRYSVRPFAVTTPASPSAVSASCMPAGGAANAIVVPSPYRDVLITSRESAVRPAENWPCPARVIALAISPMSAGLSEPLAKSLARNGTVTGVPPFAVTLKAGCAPTAARFTVAASTVPVALADDSTRTADPTTIPAVP